jgi:PKHD-type hydroxylase
MGDRTEFPLMWMRTSQPQRLGGNIAIWEDALDPLTLNAITAHGDKLTHDKALVADKPAGERITAHRITDVAWFLQNDETLPFYQSLSEAVLELNARFYKYDLWGLENFQYTVYHGAEGGHYDWHIDNGDHTDQPRKLSMSLQLSDAGDYDGCDLEIYGSSRVDVAPRKRGTIIAFPSFALHRVTPITRGRRKSLVCWVSGPEFR